MFRRILLTFVVIVIFIIGIFNGYKLMIYNEFKNYLGQKYPNITFNVSWVKYDFIYNNGFYTSVYCKNDETKFGIRKSKGNISESYIISKIRLEMNRTINSYFKDKDINKYIKNLTVGEKKQVTLSTDKEIDFRKVIDRIYVDYHDNSIQSDIEFVQISYEVIQILKRNAVDFNYISFLLERDTRVYELRLKGEEIYNKPEENVKLIRRLK